MCPGYRSLICAFTVLVPLLLYPIAAVEAQQNPVSPETPTETEATVEAQQDPASPETPTETEAAVEAQQDPASPETPTETEAAVEAQQDPDILATLIENGGVYVGVDVCKECHEDHFNQIIRTKHGQKADSRTQFATQGCESCHGPGEYHSMYPETGGLISFTGKNISPVEAQNGICLECHQRDRHLLSWFTSNHEAENMACVNCHLVHKPSKVLERTDQSKVCYRCHQNIRAQTYQASTHPIRENKLVCSDCHNPHGAIGPANLKQYTVNENCYACHAEKRGPFLWEHYPVVEDCTLCHRVHGSNHPALLVKQGPQLCQACHANIRIGRLTGSEGSSHIRRMYEFSNSTDSARMIVGKNCANCHSQVHGSNHPSGANLLR